MRTNYANLRSLKDANFYMSPLKLPFYKKINSYQLAQNVLIAKKHASYGSYRY